MAACGESRERHISWHKAELPRRSRSGGQSRPAFVGARSQSIGTLVPQRYEMQADAEWSCEAAQAARLNGV